MWWTTILTIKFATYFDIGDTNGRIYWKQPFTNAFMAPLAAFIQFRTVTNVSWSLLPLKMEMQLNAHIPDSDVKQFAPNSICSFSRTYLTPIYSPSDKDANNKAQRSRSDTATVPTGGTEAMDTTTKALRHDLEWPNRTSNPPKPIPATNTAKASAEGHIPRKTTRSKCYVQEKPPCKPVDSHKYCLGNKSSKYEECVIKSDAKWEERLKKQLKASIYDWFDPISIIRFLSTFKRALWRSPARAGMCMFSFLWDI